MKIAPINRAQQVFAASAVLTIMALTGCSAVNEQATTREYAASDGIVESVGPLDLRNVLVVTAGKGEPGAILGTIFNRSESAVRVTLEGGNGSSEVMIEGKDKYVFENEDADDATLEQLRALPGSRIDMSVTVNSEATTLSVPVMDGTLAEYREFVPGGYTPEPAPESTDEASAGTTDEPAADEAAEGH